MLAAAYIRSIVADLAAVQHGAMTDREAASDSDRQILVGMDQAGVLDVGLRPDRDRPLRMAADELLSSVTASLYNG